MLAQLGAGEWLAAATLAFSLIAALATLIWNSARANTKLEYVSDTLDTIHEERNDERKSRELLDSKLFTKLENHEGRIIKLETTCNE